MKQNINLLYDGDQPSSAVKRAIFVFIAGVAVMVLTAFGLWLSALIRDHRIETLQNHLQKKIASEVKVDSKNKVVEQKTADLKEQLKIQTRTQELLAKRRKTSVAGALVSLAQSDVEGLWFDRLIIDNDPFRLDLAGQSKSPEELVKMMMRLQEKSLYEGVSFGQLQVKQESAGAYRFHVMGVREK